MENKEPTQKQIREFWEWCGFRQETYSSYWGDNVTVWKYKDKIFGYGYQEFPNVAIDLNSLFEYAVPIAVKRIAKEYKMDLVEAKHLLFHEWFNMIRQGLEDAIALFWALDKVRQSK